MTGTTETHAPPGRAPSGLIATYHLEQDRTASPGLPEGVWRDQFVDLIIQAYRADLRPADQAVLRDLLLHPVTPHRLARDDLQNADTGFETPAPDRTVTAAPGDGAPFGPISRDFEPNLLDAKRPLDLTVANNRSVPAIDQIPVPSDLIGTVGAVLASGGPDVDPQDFDILRQALQLTGLDAALGSTAWQETSGGPSFAFFAPIDQAFLDLARGFGYAGSDEIAALDAILDVLSVVSNGTPVRLLTEILKHHIGLDALDFEDGDFVGTRVGSDTITADVFWHFRTTPRGTDQSGVPPAIVRDGPDGPVLEDADPDFPDARLLTRDILTATGRLHIIDQVLLLFDLPGPGQSEPGQILIGSEEGLPGRMTGGPGGDVFVSASSVDDMRGGPGADRFYVGSRTATDRPDIIRDFVIGEDIIDFTGRYFTPGQITIRNVLDADGDEMWVSINDELDPQQPGVLVRFGDETPLSASALTTESMFFGEANDRRGLVLVQDDDGKDALQAASDGPVIYRMADDDSVDLIRAFKFGTDILNVGAFAWDMDQLTIENVVNRFGQVRWVAVKDEDGNTEVLLRAAGGVASDASDLTESTLRLGPPPYREFDQPGPTDLIAGQDEPLVELLRDEAVYVMRDDDAVDTIRFFDDGEDLIDVAAFAGAFDDLLITERVNGAGVTRWLDIADANGTELLLRFRDAAEMKAADLTADDFLF